jgi:regulatory protein
MAARPQALSLKARAIALLAQRDHSASELRGKLLRLARGMAAARQAVAAAEAEPDAAAIDPADQAERLNEEVDALLGWLQAQGYLDEGRFVESRVHARMGRFGNLRIRQELAQHGLALDAEQQTRLKDSELERARAVWARKFGAQAPEDASARAKQSRFLAGRGFSPEVVRRLLRDAAAGGGDDAET